jgi:Xaa-Pro aminopeptidase
MINYWADYSRSGVIGGPTSEQKKYQAIVNGVTDEGVAIIESGQPGALIVDACEAGMRRRGLAISFLAGRLGHGIGLSFVEPPIIAKWDPVILAENMVVSVEPGLVRDDGVYHAEQNVLVTQKGCEILSLAPRELWTLG